MALPIFGAGRIAVPDPAPQNYNNRKAWKPRPWLSRSIRLGLWVTPVLVAAALTTLLGRWFYSSGWSLPAKILWFGTTFLLASFVATWVARGLERYIPLSTLIRANLAFPVEAPNRVKLALRIGNTTNRERVMDSFQRSGLSADPQTAAEEVLILVTQLNRHDRRTRGHSERVRALSDVIAEELGLSESDRERLRWGATLHDIGKLAVPASILNKPGKPNDEEWAILKSHPGASRERLGAVEGWLGEWVRCAWEHHERMDGTGYPAGLNGDRLPIGSRIVAVADAFEVMTANRSYKKPMSMDDARAELVRCSGTHFDPVVVRAFLRVGEKNARVGTGVFSSIITYFQAGNGPLATFTRAVMEGSTGLGVSGSAIAAKVGNVMAATITGATAIAVGAVSTITPLSATGRSQMPDQLALRTPTTTVVSIGSAGDEATVAQVSAQEEHSAPADVGSVDGEDPGTASADDAWARIVGNSSVPEQVGPKQVTGGGSTGSTGDGSTQAPGVPTSTKPPSSASASASDPTSTTTASTTTTTASSTTAPTTTAPTTTAATAPVATTTLPPPESPVGPPAPTTTTTAPTSTTTTTAPTTTAPTTTAPPTTTTTTTAPPTTTTTTTAPPTTTTTPTTTTPTTTTTTTTTTIGAAPTICDIDITEATTWWWFIIWWVWQEVNC